LAEFKNATQEKNKGLEAQVAKLQTILTPHQATKFIIWYVRMNNCISQLNIYFNNVVLLVQFRVKENPAFMYMLDKLVESIIHERPDENEVKSQF